MKQTDEPINNLGQPGLPPIEAEVDNSNEADIFQPGQLQEPETTLYKNNEIHFRFAEIDFTFSSNDLKFPELYGYYLDSLIKLKIIFPNGIPEDLKEMIEKNKPKPSSYLG